MKSVVLKHSSSLPLTLPCVKCWQSPVGADEKKLLAHVEGSVSKVVLGVRL